VRKKILGVGFQVTLFWCSGGRRIHVSILKPETRHLSPKMNETQTQHRAPDPTLVDP